MCVGTHLISKKKTNFELKCFLFNLDYNLTQSP